MKQMLVIILSTCMRDISAETEQDMDFIHSFLDIQASINSESQSLEATQICQEPHLLPIYPKDCNAHHLSEANNHLSFCKPRPTLLKIHKPKSKLPVLITTIHRCAGSCTPNNPNVTCQQATIESVIVPVTLPTTYMPKICQNASPPCSKICGKIQLFNHTQCKCTHNRGSDEYNELHSLNQVNLPENKYIKGSTTKKQDSTNNPSDFNHILLAVATLATISLATNVYLALRLKVHPSQRHHENEDEPPLTHKINLTRKETEEVTINWKFSPEESPVSETTIYQEVTPCMSIPRVPQKLNY